MDEPLEAACAVNEGFDLISSRLGQASSLAF